MFLTVQSCRLVSLNVAIQCENMLLFFEIRTWALVVPMCGLVYTLVR